MVFVAALGIAGGSVSSAGAQALPARGNAVPPAAGAGGSAQAARPIEFLQKVVFALALGPDAATQSKIAVALASELRRRAPGDSSKPARPPDGAFALKSGATPVVPEGSWGLNDYLAQCAAYPNSTQGAFIVLPPSSGSENANYLIMIRQNETIAFNVLVADCESDGAAEPHGTSKILWASDTATGEYGRSNIQVLPIAVLTSVILAFTPQRTYQTVTTRSYPAPNPLPPGGARTSVQTENQTVTNPQGTGTLQGSVVTTVGGSQLAFGRQASADHLTMHAAEDAVAKFLVSVQATCAARSIPQAAAAPSPVAISPSPTDFCLW